MLLICFYFIYCKGTKIYLIVQENNDFFTKKQRKNAFFLEVKKIFIKFANSEITK